MDKNPPKRTLCVAVENAAQFHFDSARNVCLSLNDLNSLDNLSGFNDLNSLIASKNVLDLIFPLIWHKNGLLMWDGSSKIQYFIDFWQMFFWRLWRTGMLLLTKLKGHKSNVHYSGFPKHLQTKSSLHISICQSKLKHKYLTLDTLYIRKSLNKLQRSGQA